MLGKVATPNGLSMEKLWGTEPLVAERIPRCEENAVKIWRIAKFNDVLVHTSSLQCSNVVHFYPLH